MKNLPVAVSAPLMSSSVVTMPGDKLCTTTFLMSCRGRGREAGQGEARRPSRPRPRPTAPYVHMACMHASRALGRLAGPYHAV